MNFIQDNKKCYWEKSPQKQISLFQHAQLCIHVLFYYSNRVKKKHVCNINQELKAIQGRPVCLKDSDCDYILDGTKPRDTIEYE